MGAGEAPERAGSGVVVGLAVLFANAPVVLKGNNFIVCFDFILLMQHIVK